MPELFTAPAHTRQRTTRHHVAEYLTAMAGTPQASDAGDDVGWTVSVASAVCRARHSRRATQHVHRPVHGDRQPLGLRRRHRVHRHGRHPERSAPSRAPHALTGAAVVVTKAAAVVLVTGAARGVGKETVALLSARGARVVAIVLRPDIKSLPDGFPGLLVISGDITQEKTTARAVQSAIDTFGGLDILVNKCRTHPEEARHRNHRRGLARRDGSQRPRRRSQSAQTPTPAPAAIIARTGSARRSPRRSHSTSRRCAETDGAGGMSGTGAGAASLCAGLVRRPVVAEVHAGREVGKSVAARR